MKKLFFIAAIVALLMGTAVDASAKVKKGKGKKKAQTTKTTTTTQKNIKIDQGMYTSDDATRLDNGDVADLEMAFLLGVYYEYVFNGNIYNEAYLPYVKTKFTDAALEQLKDNEGKYNWSIITGRVGDSLGVTNQNLKITRTGDKEFLVTDGGDFKCTIKVDGPEGAYKISNVSK